MAEPITGRFREPYDPDPQVNHLAGQLIDWLRQIRYTRKSGRHRLELHAKDGDIHGIDTWECKVIEMPAALRSRK